MLENTKGASKMDSPEKLATQGTQDEKSQNKNRRQYVLATTIRKQTHITYKDMNPPTNNWR